MSIVLWHKLQSSYVINIISIKFISLGYEPHSVVYKQAYCWPVPKPGKLAGLQQEGYPCRILEWDIGFFAVVCVSAASQLVSDKSMGFPATIHGPIKNPELLRLFLVAADLGCHGKMVVKRLLLHPLLSNVAVKGSAVCMCDSHAHSHFFLCSPWFSQGTQKFSKLVLESWLIAIHYFTVVCRWCKQGRFTMNSCPLSQKSCQLPLSVCGI